MEYKDYLLMPIKMKIAEFADKAEKAIKENYKNKFGIGESEIKVFKSVRSENTSYATLTFEGKWRWKDEWWGGRKYEVTCKGEEIFNCFVQLVENENVDNTTECALNDFIKWVISIPTWKSEFDIKELKGYVFKNFA